MANNNWKEEANARRLRRIASAMTLDNLGSLIDLSASQLHRYERGKAAARADIIERWETALAQQECLLEEVP